MSDEPLGYLSQEIYHPPIALVQTNFWVGSMSGLQTRTSYQGLAINNIHIKKSNPKLQLLHDVHVLVLACTPGHACLLTSPRIMSSREHHLVKPEPAELISPIALKTQGTVSPDI